MKTIYIAGPFRAENPWEVEKNIRNAEHVAFGVACMGVAFICPHSMTRYFDGTLTDDYWLAMTIELLKRCDAVYLVPGWESSRGTIAEIAEAEKLDIPVLRNYKALQDFISE